MAEAEDAAAAVDANPERGEHELPLGGRTYRLRPSYSAIAAIERKSERALPELIRMGNTGGMPLSVAGVVAAELVRAGAAEEDALTKKVSAEKMAELIFEQGIPGAIARLTLGLLDAATGGRKASGEVRAEATTTTGEGASAD